jgi:hypothetical protein
MILNPNEKGRFWDFLCYVHKNPKNSYRLVTKDNSTINALFDTACESDNCLPDDDPKYEEYWILVFKNVETNQLFEINYHNMPEEVYCDRVRIF